MKCEDVFQIYNTLKSLDDAKFDANIKFKYAIARNKKILQPIVESLQEIIQPSEELKKFEPERVELCRKYADKDEEGSPKFIEDRFIIIENREEFNKELEELREKYKEEMDKQEEKNKEFIELLKEDCKEEINFFKIDLTYFPDIELLTTGMIENLLPIIKEETLE